MEKLSDKTWSTFRVGDLFEVSRPMARSKDAYAAGDIPFVASGALNNGVMKCCTPHDDEVLDKSKCITVSPVDGSSFYQSVDFLGRGGAGSSILMLRGPMLNEATGQFIARTVKQTCSKYTYGHMGNKDSIKREIIMLPVDDSGEPDYDYMAEYTKQTREALLAKYRAYVEKRIAELGETVKIPSLNEKDWRGFLIGDLFVTDKGHLPTGKLLQKRFLREGSIPRVSATSTNNGIMAFHDAKNQDCVTSNNFISLTFLGDAFYQANEASLDMKIHSLKLKDREFNTPLAMFFLTVVQRITQGISYGNQLSSKDAVRKQVLLPVNDSGEPDYEYMEQYAKNMMLRKYKQYLAFLERQK